MLRNNNLFIYSGVPLLSSVCVPHESSAAESPFCFRHVGHKPGRPFAKNTLQHRVHSSCGSPEKYKKDKNDFYYKKILENEFV